MTDATTLRARGLVLDAVRAAYAPAGTAETAAVSRCGTCRRPLDADRKCPVRCLSTDPDVRAERGPA